MGVREVDYEKGDQKEAKERAKETGQMRGEGGSSAEGGGSLEIKGSGEVVGKDRRGGGAGGWSKG